MDKVSAIDFVHQLSKELYDLQHRLDIEILHKEAAQRKVRQYEEMTGVCNSKLGRPN